MTAEEFLALPDEGVERALIRGELREYGMTRRNRSHSRVEARIARHLHNWPDEQPDPRGWIHSGEAGFRLRAGLETIVGVDVAIASAKLVARTDPRFPYDDGPPALAVEILSPSDRHGDVVEKVRLLLDSGSVVWVVDPDYRTVRVHEPGRLPALWNDEQEMAGLTYLPGFRVAVAKSFWR